MATVINKASKYTLTGVTGINGFLGSIAASGGMSMSNLYEARFENIPASLKTVLRDYGFIDLDTTGGAFSAMTAFCEEASLPGIQAMTGQTTGRLMGEGQVNYPHTKSYTDITLGWTCDANLLPVKFLNGWMSHIFQDLGTNPSGKTSTNRVNYQDEYCADIVIKKAERNSTNSLGRVAGIYTLYCAWPYSIQSTPLSYGSSTLLKVTASFYYRRWKFEPKQIPDT